MYYKVKPLLQLAGGWAASEGAGDEGGLPGACMRGLASALRIPVAASQTQAAWRFAACPHLLLRMLLRMRRCAHVQAPSTQSHPLMSLPLAAPSPAARA